MASSRNLITTEPRGTDKFGTYFNDVAVIQDLEHTVLTRIVVHHKPHIQSLTMSYTCTNATVTRGGTGGTRSEIELKSGELITTIEGITDRGNNVITQLTFWTNRGTIFGPYGSVASNANLEPFMWKATNHVSAGMAPHMGLLCFSGHACGNYLRRLVAVFALNPDRAQSPREIKHNLPEAAALPTASVAVSSFARNLMSPVVTLLVGADNVVFHASEATLCRVPFFRAALQGQSGHAAEKRIWLPEDVPPIFSALLEHLYTGTYTYNRTIVDGTLTHDLPEGRFHVSVYAVATKYRWQPLVKAAVRNFLVVLPVLSGIDIVRLWKAAYEAGLTMSVCDSDGRLADFQRLLPKLLQGLYVTDTAEMESTIADLPSLANDIIRLLVAAGGN